MITLALDPKLVRTEINTWREAALLTRCRSTLDRECESRILGARMTGAADRVDGFLMLLQCCSTVAHECGEIAQLVAELREFREWVQQGQQAAQIIQTLSPKPAVKRAQPRPQS